MKYHAHIISICNYAPQPEESSVVGYSEAMVDYPFIPRPGSVIYDYVNLYKPMGRHPVTKLPLWIDEPNTARREQEIEEDGIGSMGADVAIADNPIDASLCNCQISNDLMVVEIDEDAKYVIWGVHEVDGEALPPAFADWLDSDPVSAERKTTFNEFMLARGTAQSVLDDYWLANPDATYLEVVDDFKLFV